MAFDRDNTTQLQQLYDERTLDPLTMNYPANDDAFVSRINDPARNVGGETVSREFDVLAMMDALDPTDFDAQQTVTGAANYVATLVNLGAYESITDYEQKFRSLFAANSGTITALNTQTSPISRAQVLWGVDTVIVVDDWITARQFVEGA
jgi:hypothetical protein